MGLESWLKLPDGRRVVPPGFDRRLDQIWVSRPDPGGLGSQLVQLAISEERVMDSVSLFELGQMTDAGIAALEHLWDVKLCRMYAEGWRELETEVQESLGLLRRVFYRRTVNEPKG